MRKSQKTGYSSFANAHPREKSRGLKGLLSLSQKMNLLTTEEIVQIMERFKKQNPSPKSELDYTNAFTLLVAVVLSAQATDKSVNKATKDLFKIADTP